MALPVERLCESQSRILPWWAPQSIAVAYSKNGKPAWTTPPRIGDLASYATFATSPFDTEGKCHFLAFDIDSGKEEDVDCLLQALPKGAVPVISVSGRKGWHVWVYPSEPIRGEVACGFARAVAKKAGVSCETFPSSPEKSRCLKWPGCPHPETGNIETFLEWRGDKHELDTRIMLEAIEGGMFRTPVRVISGMRLTPQAPLGSTGTSTPEPPQKPPIYLLIDRGTQENPSVRLLSAVPKLSLADWFKDDAVALAMVHRLGARVRRVGAPFCCVLPGHRERRPSASLYQCENGVIVYHDWHASKFADTNEKVLEFLTLSEVYAASVSGVVRELPSAHQQAAWGMRFLMEAGFIGAPDVDAPLLPEGFPGEARQVFEGFIKLAQVRRLANLDDAAQFSERFAASWCAVSPSVACKATNLLVAVGALKKHELPATGNHQVLTGTFSFGTATTEEMAAVYDVLGRPSVTQFNKQLVRERLGDEAAQAIFRR